MSDRERVSGMTWRSLGLLVLITAVTAIPALAQIPTGTILGTIKDPSGGVLAAASVTVHNTETGQDRSTQTGEDGAYRFSALPVGHYDITAERSGFKTSTQRGVTLDVAQEVVTNFSLEVGAASQTVEVTGEAPVINTTSGTLGGLVNEEKIADLPLNGRDYADLTLLQPGVSQNNSVVNLGGGTQGVIYSSNGAPIRSNNYLIDGAPMQNIFGFNAASASGSSLGLDGIREYRVITNAFPAEYGMTMGSQMVIVSKGGSNQFHGDAFEYLRNRVMDARNFFDSSQSDCLQAGNPLSDCPRSPTYERNNFGGAFGGPIRKDKTFFWGVYEGLRQVKGNPVVTKGISGQCVAEGLAANSGQFTIPGNPGKSYTVPGNYTVDDLCDPALPASGLGSTIAVPSTIRPYLALYDPADSIYTEVSPTNVNFGQMRVDQFFSDKDQAFVRYTIDQASETVPGPGFGATPYGYKEFNDDWTSRDQYLSLSETHDFSASLLNSARLSWSRTNVPTNYINNSSATGVSTSSCTTPKLQVASATGQVPFPCDPGTDVSFLGGGNPMGLVVIGAAATGGSSALTTMGPDFASPNYHLQTYFTLGDDINYTHGTHSFKFGFLGNRVIIVDGEPVFARGVVDFIGCAPAFAAPIFANNGVGDALDCFLSNSPTLTMEAPPSTGMANAPNLDPRRHFRYETYGVYGQDDWRATSRLTLNLGVRYEFNTVINEVHGIQNALTSYTATALTPGPEFKNPSLHNFGPRVGFAYDPFGKGKTAIRGAFGIYYDISTIGDTTFPETVGDPPYRETNGFNAAPAGFTMSPGWITSSNYQGIFTPQAPCAGASLATPCAGAFPGPGATNSFTGYEPYLAFNEIAYNQRQPTLYQWNLSIDEQLPGNIGLTVSYVGTRGVHLWGVTDDNPCQPTNAPGSQTLNGDVIPNTAVNWVNAANAECPAGYNNETYNNNSTLPAGTVATTSGQPCPQYSFVPGTTTVQGGANGVPYGFSSGPAGNSNDGRFNCSFAGLVGINTDSRSWYDALQVQVNKKLGHGLEFQSSYTWAKELDTTDGQLFIDTEIRTPGVPLNFDKGPGVINAAQNWRFNMLYHFGTWNSDNLLAKFTHGWWMGNIISIQSGYNFSPGDAQDNEENTLSHNNGGYERPDFVTTANLQYALAQNPQAVVYNPGTVYTHQANQWFNPNMFTLQPPGDLSTVSRGFLIGPGLVDWDFSMNKDTKLKWLGEAGNLQFRAEIFNVANHPNLIPNNATGNSFYNSCGLIGTNTGNAPAGSCVGEGALFSARDGRDIQIALKLNF
jgi:hypothetical protein